MNPLRGQHPHNEDAALSRGGAPQSHTNIQQQRRTDTTSAAGETSARPAAKRIKLRSWKRIHKPGSSLIGVASVALPFGEAWLEIDDLPVLMTAGKAWATWPAKPMLTAQGAVARIPGTAKTRYVSILRWGDRETSQRFSRAVVDLVRAKDPGAFDDDGAA